MTDGFARTTAAIDAELKAQCIRRNQATTELLHALFVIERSSGVIDRLLAERSHAEVKPERVRSR